MKTILYTSALTLSLALLAETAFAHTVWLEPAVGHPGDYKVMFGGHDGKVETFPPAKLKSVLAMDAQGKPLKVERTDGADSVMVHIGGKPALISAYLDNGVYSKTPDGHSVNTPMDQTPGAKTATDNIKYHKTIVQWTSLVTRPIGQPIEVIPMNATEPRAGQPMKVQVRFNGKPAAGIRLGRGEEKVVGGEITDANGMASFMPEHGFNKLWAGRRVPVTGNPHYTEESYEYLLGFDAK